MDIHDYRKKRLKRYNRVLNFFLGIMLSFVIFSLIGVGMFEASFRHFESRGNIFPVQINDFLHETASEFLQQEVEAQTLEIPDNLPEGDLCTQLNIVDIPDEYSTIAEEICAEGPVTREDLPAIAIEMELDRFKEEMKPEIQSKYNESITNGKLLMEDLKQQYPFMRMHVLTLMFSFLLVLYFFNNDIVLTINYIAKKLVYLVPVIFILPYFMFKFDFLKFIVRQIDISRLANLPAPIDPKVVVIKAVEMVSNEMALFYLEFLPYAFLALSAGLILWFGNIHYLIPFFVKKYNFLQKEVTDKSPIVKKVSRDKNIPKFDNKSGNNIKFPKPP
ncbi:hypothetical protein ACFLTH_11055 [Bacteroidota bacterium]